MATSCMFWTYFAMLASCGTLQVNRCSAVHKITRTYTNNLKTIGRFEKPLKGCGHMLQRHNPNWTNAPSIPQLPFVLLAFLSTRLRHAYTNRQWYTRCTYDYRRISCAVIFPKFRQTTVFFGDVWQAFPSRFPCERFFGPWNLEK